MPKGRFRIPRAAVEGGEDLSISEVRALWLAPSAINSYATREGAEKPSKPDYLEETHFKYSSLMTTVRVYD